MSNRTQFTVSEGILKASCLLKTQEFMEQNLKFFQQALSQISTEFAADGEPVITFIAKEEKWSFAAKIERTELGEIVEASGSLTEGTRAQFDDILSELEPK